MIHFPRVIQSPEGRVMHAILQRPIFLELKCTTGCGPHGFWHIDAVILIAEIITETTRAEIFFINGL